MSYFKGIFSQDPVYVDYYELDIIDFIITEYFNSILTVLFEKEIIRDVVFSMDPDSSSDSDFQ